MSNLHICPHCNKSFSRKDAVLRHIRENRCKHFKSESNESDNCSSDMSVKRKIKKVSLIPNLETRLKRLEEQLSEKNKIIEELKSSSLQNRLEKQIEQLREQTQKEIAELKEKPVVNNQILQVVCIGNNDNYLDMLTQRLGNFDKALEYIKDCALSSLIGDCKLIEKIYMEGQQPTVNSTTPAIRYLDKSRTKIEYFNENTEKVIENKDLFVKKLANNLQNSYLKGANHLINQNLNNHLCPNKFLEEYDLQIWNQHIYDLSDYKYHRKIINQLNIPLQ